MKYFLIITLSIITLTSCRQYKFPSRAGFIIGPTNEIIQLTSQTGGPNNEFIKSSQSVALIATEITGRTKFCTGSLVQGQDALYILTNFHCFAKVNPKTNEMLNEFLPEACNNTTVYFDLRADHKENIFEYHCQPGSLVGNKILDLAKFKLKNFDNKVAPLGFSEGPLVSNRKAFLIHYPDIEANYVFYKGKRLPAASITISQCQVFGDFAKEEWHLDPTLPYSLRNDCDLIHGSSGAPLFDLQTKKILGTVWGGIQFEYESSKLRKDNAAIKAHITKEFLFDRNISIARTTQDNNNASSSKDSHDSYDTSSQKEPSFQDKVGKKVQKIFCGIIGTKQNRTTWFELLGALIFTIPLGIAFRRYSRYS